MSQNREPPFGCLQGNPKEAIAILYRVLRPPHMAMILTREPPRKCLARIKLEMRSSKGPLFKIIPIKRLHRQQRQLQRGWSPFGGVMPVSYLGVSFSETNLSESCNPRILRDHFLAPICIYIYIHICVCVLCACVVEGTWSLHDPFKSGWSLPKIKGSWTHCYFGS